MVVDQDVSGANEVASEIGGLAMGADVALEEDIIRVTGETERQFGRIDLFCSNAGIACEDPTTAASTSNEVWDRMWSVNVMAHVYAARAVLPGMMDRNYGRIVQMSSVTGPVVGISGSAVYGAAKAGMLGMARSLAIEAGPHNVTVNCIGPGWIKTASSSEDEIVAGRYTPAGRPGTPEEVGHVAVFLASAEASYITGQLIVVDGGNTVQEYKIALEGRY